MPESGLSQGLPDTGSMERVTLYRWRNTAEGWSQWTVVNPDADYELSGNEQQVEFVPLAELDRLREALEEFLRWYDDEESPPALLWSIANEARAALSVPVRQTDPEER